ncbi:molecular chaperone DnaJ [Marinobacter sp.]|uniref:molecular chaperone DnaJ n=1 Tax=Marinobacter sp. TaxID=50741 RepID=UPI001B577258|nr:molecular chaperone DnaJ [Marinobacter sp.]MBQ0831729.1 molecular chaperone DnaJ [Marinobacter sp.]
MHWILGIALAATVFVILKQWGGLSTEKKKAATWKLVLIAGGIFLLVMVLTGRVHVLTAAIAALIPLLRKLPGLIRFFPALNRLLNGENNAKPGDRTGPGTGQAQGNGMTEREACEVLNVTAACSREDVVLAHRRLIQKLHPDRGGSDYLAAKINEAKSVLLSNRV